MPDSDTKVSKIGGFELLTTLGKGGMGVVFKARQVSMDRLVALKVLSPRLAKDEAYVARFLREARSAAKLNHPNIVQGIDAGEAGGYYYFAMEFVDGITVKELLKRQGRIEEKQALNIVGAVARALEEAHRHGIVHRDIKPENIMLNSRGVVKLADLGLARASEKPDTLTTEGVAVGTPYYMAPEQVRGNTQLDTRSDIYALGATLYHMVTGDFPFTGPNAGAIMAKHLAEPAPVAKEKHPDVSRATSELIARMMAKDPADRPQTPTELLAEIRDALAGKVHLRTKPVGSRQSAVGRQQPVGGASVPRASSAPKSRTTLFAAVVIIALLAIVGIIVATRRPEETASTPPTEKTKLVKPPDDKLQPPVDDGEAKRKAELAEKGRIAKAREEALAKARQQGEELLRQADDAIAAKDFPKARAALKSAEALGIPELAAQAKAKREEIASREQSATEWAKWDGIKSRARKLADAGQFDEAARLLRTGQDVAIDAIGNLIDKEIEGVGAAKRKAAEAALAAYAKESDKVWALFKQRKYPEAENALMNLPQVPNLREVMQADLEAAKLLKEFWAAVERGVMARKGRFVSIAGRGGNVESVEAGNVTLKVGDKEFVLPLFGMNTRQAAAIADLKDDERGNLVRAVFLLAEGQELEAAEKALAAAGNPPALPVYKARVAGLLARMGRTPAVAHPEQPESDPEKALALATRNLAAGDYVAARRALEAALKAKPGDPRARRLLAEALARLVQQALDACKDADFANAKKLIPSAEALQPDHPDVAALTNWLKASSRPVFSDDFDRASSLASWHVRSGTWKIDRGELVCEYDQEAMVFLKRAPFQDFVFECDMKNVGEKPGLVLGVLFRYTSRRWLYALLYDAFDQAEGGGATGRGWYLQSGPRAAETTPRAKDVTNRYARLNIQTGDTYHLKLKCIGKDIECFINGKLEFQLTDEKPTAGELALLGAGVLARFDNLRLYRVVPLPELKAIEPPGPAAQEAEPSRR